MTLRYFETEHAEYCIGLGNHGVSSEPIFKNVDFSSIDFLVLEDGGSAQLLLESLSTLPTTRHSEESQYYELCMRAFKENPELPIYGIDVRTQDDFNPSSSFFHTATALTGKIGMATTYAYTLNKVFKNKPVSRRAILGILGSVGLLTFSMTYPLIMSHLIENDSKNAKEFPLVAKATTAYTLLHPAALMTYRDAITAKKIEEHLVPKHTVSEKKVRVAILYGAGHAGIELMLKHPQLREERLHYFQERLNPEQQYTPNRTELNAVRCMKRTETLPSETTQTNVEVIRDVTRAHITADITLYNLSMTSKWAFYNPEHSRDDHVTLTIEDANLF